MKFYLNGFPKSGLHLLDALVKPLTLNPEADWAGTYTSNSWTLERGPVERITNALCYLPDNCRIKGHACFDEDIDLYLYLSGVVHIFIHRDLRDVAVSQAHHILSEDDETFRHPGKEEYWRLGDFENVLSAVWHGIHGYPGVAERWSHYETWLKSANTLCLNYDEVMADLYAAAERIKKWGAYIKPNYPGILNEAYIDASSDAMVASARDTGKSLTFRRACRASGSSMRMCSQWSVYDRKTTEAIKET